MGLPKQWRSILEWSNYAWFGVPTWLRKPSYRKCANNFKPLPRYIWPTFRRRGGGSSCNLKSMDGKGTSAENDMAEFPMIQKKGASCEAEQCFGQLLSTLRGIWSQFFEVKLPSVWLMTCQWHVNDMSISWWRLSLHFTRKKAVIRRSPTDPTGPSLVNATSDVCRRSKSSHWIPWDQSFSAMNIDRQPSQLGFCHERIVCQFFEPRYTNHHNLVVYWKLERFYGCHAHAAHTNSRNHRSRAECSPLSTSYTLSVVGLLIALIWASSPSWHRGTSKFELSWKLAAQTCSIRSRIECTGNSLDNESKQSATEVPLG